MSAAERVWLYIHEEPNTGCWLWSGSLNNNGYPNFAADGRVVKGHRFVYEMFRGQIPAGLTLDHLCRVRCCVNPAHLEPVTHAENCKRRRSRATHCSKGHPFSAENTLIFAKKDGSYRRRSCRICYWEAQRFYAKKRRARLKATRVVP